MIKRRGAKEVFPEPLKDIWSKVELRSAVVVSLIIQITLILFARHRKRMSNALLIFILWVAYLLADSMAVFALSHVSDTENDSKSSKKNNDDLLGFWAPFLLLHLGGPDTITAFSLEDNELWRRHFLTLAYHVFLSIYSFIRCLTTNRLVAPSCLVFIAGLIKYGERTWALRYASKDHFKDVLLASMEADEDYFNLVEKFYAFSSGGIPAKLELEKFDPEPEAPIDNNEVNISDEVVFTEAYRFFKIFRRLIVNLFLGYKELRESQRFCFKRSTDQVFNVIGIELNLFYDVLFTKSVIVHSLKGCIFRLISFMSVVLALLLFIFATNKDGYERTDIVVSYVLLGGAITIEIYAFSMMILSDLTMVWITQLGHAGLLKVFKRVFFFFHPPNRARWSNSMGQYNLIRICYTDRSPSMRNWKAIAGFFRLKETWEKWYHTKIISVQPELMDFICKEIKSNVINCMDPNEYRQLYSHRGEWALQKYGFRGELGWSVEGEFDECILVWHVATDLCRNAPSSNPPTTPSEMSKYISDYMLHVVVNLPDMVTAGIGDIRFKDTYEEVNYFIKDETIDNEGHASTVLLDKRSVLDIPVVKGKNRSVLYKAGKLATLLRNINNPDIEWSIISQVWVEMLSYTASHCRGDNHAQKLSSGGELLTFVWLLMTHLGIVEEDNTKVKLVVHK